MSYSSKTSTRAADPAPAVDVVIATRDRRPLLAAAMASVLGQTAAPATITVVADGCRDDTEEFLTGLSDSRLRVISTPGVGPAAARNAGLSVGSAPLVAFLDDDNVWAPTYLRRMLTALGDGVLAHCAERLELHDRPIGGPIAVATRPAAFRPAELIATNCFDTSAVLVRRREIAAHGAFDGSLHCAEDWALFGRIALAHPAAVVSVNEPLVTYRCHLSGALPSVTNLAFGDEALLRWFPGECPALDAPSVSTGAAPTARASVAAVRVRLAAALLAGSTARPCPPAG